MIIIRVDENSSCAMSWAECAITYMILYCDIKIMKSHDCDSVRSISRHMDKSKVTNCDHAQRNLRIAITVHSRARIVRAASPCISLELDECLDCWKSCLKLDGNREIVLSPPLNYRKCMRCLANPWFCHPKRDFDIWFFCSRIVSTKTILESCGGRLWRL